MVRVEGGRKSGKRGQKSRETLAFLLFCKGVVVVKPSRRRRGGWLLCK